MGYNIGCRLIEEFLAKSKVQSCNNFKETGHVIAKVAFKMFLGISADATKWSANSKQFSLVFKGNPLQDFVQLPSHLSGLHYCNILCGIIRGALCMVRMVVECQYLRSELHGNPESEIQITLKEMTQEEYVDDED